MGHTNLPNLGKITDQLRVDNNVVVGRSEGFLVGSNPAPAPEAVPTQPEIPTSPKRAQTDAFPFMRAYGCLGRKHDEQK
jgi:hypothetical protein